MANLLTILSNPDDDNDNYDNNDPNNPRYFLDPWVDDCEDCEDDYECQPEYDPLEDSWY